MLDQETDKKGDKDAYYAAWYAEDPATGDKFIALFNLGSKAKEVGFKFEMEDMPVLTKFVTFGHRNK
ncbi:hypothetical protein C2869_00015 [Saccharobesus litoralis]|uniref:Uncharacterized protein n=1 Tax=Saccharobesus litoralis TaxID=2172099 RepID=A0A2S0VL41_9ALTE|nr:hypothetical protein [Saccharobesus litoralis]AWB64922.1 hypothetical protein C2869_00015 [Saccharobesus litoralis]